MSRGLSSRRTNAAWYRAMSRRSCRETCRARRPVACRSAATRQSVASVAPDRNPAVRKNRAPRVRLRSPFPTPATSPTPPGNSTGRRGNVRRPARLPCAPARSGTAPGGARHGSARTAHRDGSRAAAQSRFRRCPAHQSAGSAGAPARRDTPPCRGGWKRRGYPCKGPRKQTKVGQLRRKISQFYPAATRSKMLQICLILRARDRGKTMGAFSHAPLVSHTTINPPLPSCRHRP